jgi:hypothetical protein
VTTTQECQQYAPVCSKHAAKTSDGESSRLTTGAATLSYIAGGGSTAATSSQIYSQLAADAATAQMRAANSGDPEAAIGMKNVARIFTQLSVGA